MRGALVVAFVVLALAGAVSAVHLAAGAATTVRVSAKEFLFVPKQFTASAGEVTFVVKNEGAIEHNFIVEDASKKKVAEIAVLEPAQTVEVHATLRSGAYIIYCSLPGHREVGMTGTLAVP